MKKQILAAMLAAAVVTPAAMPTAAVAQRHDDWRWNGDNGNGWNPSDHYRRGSYRERRLSRNDRIYRGGDGRYYCRRSDGTTGLVVGAVAGGLLGSAIGGDTLSALIGGAGGALLGRSVDRGNIRCR
jgi:hypothetical protein